MQQQLPEQEADLSRGAVEELRRLELLPQPDIYTAAWLRRRQEKNIEPQPDPALAEEEDEPGLTEPETTPDSAQDAPPPLAPPSVESLKSRSQSWQHRRPGRSYPHWLCFPR